MASSKSYPTPPPIHSTTPLLPHHDQNHAVLISSRFTHRQSRAISIACVAFLILVYTVWPSSPDLEIVRIRLNHIRIRTSPRVLIDVSLHLTVKVRNPDMYSMDYRMVDVAIGYRGRMLGHVRSEDGHVRPLGSSYVDVDVEFDGAEVLNDLVFLLEDLARGSVPFDTVTTIEGQVGVLFFSFPRKANISCELLVNAKKQEVIRQNCYTE